MMDLPEPEDLYDDLEPEGQESEPDTAVGDERTAAPHNGANGKSRAAKPTGLPASPQPTRLTGSVNKDDDLEEGALEDGETAGGSLHDSELDEILALLFEDPPSRRKPAPPRKSLAEQAASLVARHSSQVSTADVFEDGAGLMHGSEFLEMYASAALLESAGLIQAMAQASARTAFEKEAGLLAAANVPIIMQGYPSFYRGLWPAIPALSTGADVLARYLHRSGKHRPLLVGLPGLLRGVIERLARELTAGRPVTTQAAAAIFANHTRAWLSARTKDQPARGKHPYQGEE